MHSLTARRRGVTLLELVVVLAVVIVMSAVAMPGLSSLVADSAVSGAASRLQQDIRLVQQYSIMRREGYPTYYLALDAGSGSYALHLDGKVVSRTLPSGLNMTLDGFASPLSFDPMGRPSEGTTPTGLANDCSVVIGNAGATKRIRVTVGAVMGRISTDWLAR